MPGKGRAEHGLNLGLSVGSTTLAQTDSVAEKTGGCSHLPGLNPGDVERVATAPAFGVTGARVGAESIGEGHTADCEHCPARPPVEPCPSDPRVHPWYEDSPPLGYEELGVCGVPHECWRHTLDRAGVDPMRPAGDRDANAPCGPADLRTCERKISGRR